MPIITCMGCEPGIIKSENMRKLIIKSLIGTWQDTDTLLTYTKVKSFLLKYFILKKL